MTVSPYPRYEDSGIEWLGRLPSHWRVKRLKRVATAFPSNVDKKSHDGETPVLLCNYTDVYYNDRIVAGMDFMEATATDEEIARFTVRGGDVIITKDSETADDIAIAAYVPEDIPGVLCGYHLTMVRALPGSSGLYLKWLFGSRYLRARFEVAANGLTRVGLGQYAVDNVDLPVPPEPEQRAIAAFLDRETARIDALVAEQERLIELLREKRQAVISHAVTKGLDPTVPMKDSGVEWLGEVPGHWALSRLGRELRESPCYGVLVPDVSDDGETSVPMLRIVDIDHGCASTGSLVRISRTLSDRYRRTVVSAGDLVLSVVGTIGETLRVSDELAGANLSRALARLQLGDEIDVGFLDYYLRSGAFQVFVDLIAVGTAQKVLNMGDLARLPLPLPTMAAQREIAFHLDEETSRCDALIAAAQLAVGLLLERRSALISAAVTGQIDVRNLAPEAAA